MTILLTINDGNPVFPQEVGIATATTQKIIGFPVAGFRVRMYLGVDILFRNSGEGSYLPRVEDYLAVTVILGLYFSSFCYLQNKNVPFQLLTIVLVGL